MVRQRRAYPLTRRQKVAREAKILALEAVLLVGFLAVMYVFLLPYITHTLVTSVQNSIPTPGH